jgi:hypothetical protein
MHADAGKEVEGAAEKVMFFFVEFVRMNKML